MRELMADLLAAKSSAIELPKQEKSIVVLPFENLSPDPDQEYFSDGLTEEVISDLSNARALRVISRSSAMTFKGTKKKIPEIAREVNVQYVLEGSVRKAGNNLRITAQLIDATNDAHLWAEKYAGTLDDVFDIQEKVARAIVDALELKLTPEESQRMAKRPIENLQAYECHVRARQEVWQYSADALHRALQYVHNAMNIVGENPLLYADLGLVYWQQAHAGVKVGEELFQKAEECVKKVFELEPESPHGFRLQGFLEYARGKQKEALRNFKRALAADPNDADSLYYIILISSYIMGKTKSLPPLLERLLQIDPLTPINYCLPAVIHSSEGRYEPAVELFKRFYEMGPQNPVAQLYYAAYLAAAKRYEEAYGLWDHLVETIPGSVMAAYASFWKYALQGEKSKALGAVTHDLVEHAKSETIQSFEMGRYYALLKERDAAFSWLENAISRGLINYPLVSSYDPYLESIRGEERFKKLVERVKKEWEEFEV
jgi:TolB-like protein/lipoprotein NlpI